MPCGVVVRAIAEHVHNKHTDPAVVVVDVGGRWAVSLLSGHEGGANQLAVDVANALDAEPVVSTTTDANKTLIAGIGCRKGIAADRIIAAVESAIASAGAHVEDVRLLASVDLKRNETGLLQSSTPFGHSPAAHLLGDDLQFNRLISPIRISFKKESACRRWPNLPPCWPEGELDYYWKNRLTTA